MTREEREKAIKEFQQIVESAEWVDSSTADGVSIDLIKCAIEALQRCQEIDNKFANATNTDWVRKGFTDAEVKDICDDARKALQTDQLKESQEIFNKDSETESMLNADLISRQAAIEFLKRPFSASFMMEYLENAPSVQPEQKVGKWIHHKDWENEGWCRYECNQCGMGSDVDYKFCMRCGAKMEEGGANAE